MGNILALGLLGWLFTDSHNNRKCIDHQLRKTPEELAKEKRQVGLTGLKAKIRRHPQNFYDEFANDVLNNKVVLEDIFISGRHVSMLIAIPSDEHHPKVTVRYTTDSWKTESDEEATPFSTDENSKRAFQRFFFMISVPLGKSLEFAVRNMDDQGVIWDNHNHGNFKVDNVQENEDPARLIAKFIPDKQAMIEKITKSVSLKGYFVKDGKATLKIATKGRSNEPPVVHYTFDDWTSVQDATSIERKGTERGLIISECHLDIPKQAKMKFALRWRHESIEYWDNNGGKNYEIQG